MIQQNTEYEENLFFVENNRPGVGSDLKLSVLGAFVVSKEEVSCILFFSKNNAKRYNCCKYLCCKSTIKSNVNGRHFFLVTLSGLN